MAMDNGGINDGGAGSYNGGGGERGHKSSQGGIGLGFNIWPSCLPTDSLCLIYVINLLFC